MERNVAERERSGERTKSAAPAIAPEDILQFSLSLHVTQINRPYSKTQVPFNERMQQQTLNTSSQHFSSKQILRSNVFVAFDFEYDVC